MYCQLGNAVLRQKKILHQTACQVTSKNTNIKTVCTVVTNIDMTGKKITQSL